MRYTVSLSKTGLLKRSDPSQFRRSKAWAGGPSQTATLSEAFQWDLLTAISDTIQRRAYTCI